MAVMEPVGCHGLKGYFEEAVPWIIMFWCLAHRLELAVKDALKSTLFDDVDDILLRAYYIYKWSPKKCRKLEEIVATLKECLDEVTCLTRVINQFELVGLNLLIIRWQP